MNTLLSVFSGFWYRQYSSFGKWIDHIHISGAFQQVAIHIMQQLLQKSQVYVQLVWSWFIECRLVDSHFVGNFFHFSYSQSATVQPQGVLDGRAPSFSIQLKGFEFSDLGIQCFSINCVDELRVGQTAFNKPALNRAMLKNCDGCNSIKRHLLSQRHGLFQIFME